MMMSPCITARVNPSMYVRCCRQGIGLISFHPMLAPAGLSGSLDKPWPRGSSLPSGREESSLGVILISEASYHFAALELLLDGWELPSSHELNSAELGQ